MAALDFKISAQYKELTNAIAELDKLETKIQSIKSPNLDFEHLNRQMEQLSNSVAQKMQIFAQMSVDSNSKAIEVKANYQTVSDAISEVTKLNEWIGKVNANKINLDGLKEQSTAIEKIIEQKQQLSIPTSNESEIINAQAMAYRDYDEALKSVMGSREQNARLLVIQQSALSNVRSELSNLNKTEKEKGRLTNEEITNKSKLIIREQQLKQSISELSILLSAETKKNQAKKTSMDGMSLSLGRLKDAYRKLSSEQRSSPFGQQLLAQIKATDAEIKRLDASIGNHQRNVGHYSKFSSETFRGLSGQVRAMGGVFGTLPAPLQRITQGMGAMTRATLKFIATPIGAVIAAIVIGIQALTSWFKKSEVGQMAFAKASGYVSGVLKVLEKAAVTVGDAIYKAFSNPKEAIKQLWEEIKINLVNRVNGLGKMFQAVGKIISSGFTSGYKDLGNAFLQTTTGIENLIEKTKQAANAFHNAGKDESDRKGQLLNIDNKRKDIQDKLLDLELNGKGNAKEINKLKKENIALLNQQIALEEKAGNKEKVRELKGERNSLSSQLSSPGKSPKAETPEEVYDAQFELEQERINAMQDGYKKQRAQVELNHRKQLNELKKRGTEINEAEKALLLSYYETQRKLEQNKINVDETDKINAQIQKDQEYWNKYIEEFGDYQDRRLAIIQEYDQKIAEAVSGGEKALLEAQKNKALTNLDVEEFKKAINFAEIFSNIDEKSTPAIETLRDKLASYIEQSADKLTPEQLKPLSDALLRMNDTLKDRKPAQGLKQSISVAKQAYKDLKNAEKEGLSEENVEKFAIAYKNAMAKVASDIQNVLGHFNEFGGISQGLIGHFNDDAADMVGDLLDIASGAGQAGVGVAKLASGDIIGGMKDLAKGISNVVGGIIRMNDKVKERKIQELQRQIENLNTAYQDLQDSINEVYASDKAQHIEQMKRAKEKQKELIKQQIEQEKAKKKTDWNKIREWERQIKDIDNEIIQLGKSAEDAIFGESVQSAIENFASAYMSAWESGDDKAKSSKDIAVKMIKAMIAEAMKASVADTFMANLRRKMKEFLENDGIIDDAEQSVIDNMVEQMTEQLDAEFGWADKYFKKQGSQGAASYGAYEKITQEQASSIDGRLTAIQMDNVGILEQGKLSVLALNAIGVKLDMSNKLLDEIRMHNENIQEYTSRIPDKNYNSDVKGLLEKIKSNTENL